MTSGDTHSSFRSPRKRPPVIITASPTTSVPSVSAELAVPGLHGQDALPDRTLSGVVNGTDKYVADLRHESDRYLRDLEVKADTAWQRERVLWQLFVLVFMLTLAAGSGGVALIFLASLKVAIASGAAGLIPGATSALLKREYAAQSKNRQAIEAKLDEQNRLRQADAAISKLDPGPEKKKLEVQQAQKLLSRIPK
jgi:hypothetical protein